jgi:hypothetical protein
MSFPVAHPNRRLREWDETSSPFRRDTYWPDVNYVVLKVHRPFRQRVETTKSTIPIPRPDLFAGAIGAETLSHRLHKLPNAQWSGL